MIARLRAILPEVMLSLALPYRIRSTGICSILAYDWRWRRQHDHRSHLAVRRMIAEVCLGAGRVAPRRQG
jgi:hypothetical protein